MGWKKGSFLSIDTETTGLGPDARVCQVGLVEFYRGRPIEHWSALCNPGDDVPWEDEHVVEALQVNGLDPADLKQAPPIRYLTDRIVQYAERCPIWVGHNIGFDINLLQLGRHIRRRPLVVVDTILVDTVLSHCAPSRSLRSMAARCNIDEQDAHNALSDALTAGMILVHYWDRLPDKPEDLQWMMETGYMLRCAEMAKRSPGRVVQKPVLKNGIDWYESVAEARQSGYVQPVLEPTSSAEGAK